MGNDRVAAVNDSGVVTALIEHTHINSEVVGQVYGTVHGTLIRADDHEMILVDL